MFMFFMDARGLILQHAVPAGTTVNAAYYQKVRFKRFKYFISSTKLLLLKMLFFGLKFNLSLTVVILFVYVTI